MRPRFVKKATISAPNHGICNAKTLCAAGVIAYVYNSSLCGNHDP